MNSTVRILFVKFLSQFIGYIFEHMRSNSTIIFATNLIPKINFTQCYI